MRDTFIIILLIYLLSACERPQDCVPENRTEIDFDKFAQFDTIYYDDSLRVYINEYFTPDGDGYDDFYSIIIINYKSMSYTLFKAVDMTISNNCRILYHTNEISYPSGKIEYSEFALWSPIWDGKYSQEGVYNALINVVLPNSQILDTTLNFELHRRKD
jgi:hypothetical protein